MTRTRVLDSVRAALGRTAIDPVTPLRAWKMPAQPIPDLVARFRLELEAVAGEFVDARGKDLDEILASLGEAGVVHAAAGIAETGTVVIERDGDHRPSLLPETSVVVLSESDLAAGLEDLPPPGPDTRARILITGPSRTSDIEKKLVLGAHGPKRVVVVVVGHEGRSGTT